VTHIVNPHDHGVHVGERCLTLEGQRHQRETDGGEHENGHLQIGVHHQRIAILLQVPFRGAGDSGVALVSSFIVSVSAFISNLFSRVLYAAYRMARAAIRAAVRPPCPPPLPPNKLCDMDGILKRM
jgi:hypothetical protein